MISNVCRLSDGFGYPVFYLYIRFCSLCLWQARKIYCNTDSRPFICPACKGSVYIVFLFIQTKQPPRLQILLNDYNIFSYKCKRRILQLIIFMNVTAWTITWHNTLIYICTSLICMFTKLFSDQVCWAGLASSLRFKLMDIHISQIH